MYGWGHIFLVTLYSNTHVGDEIVENVVGRHSVLGRNENEERIIRLCIERDGDCEHLVQEGYPQVYMGETRKWKSCEFITDRLCGVEE